MHVLKVSSRWDTSEYIRPDTLWPRVPAALMIYCRHFIIHSQKSSLTAYLVRGGYRGWSERGEKACEGL